VPAAAHVLTCVVPASAACRQLLSGLFTADAAVRQLVGGAVLPATVMLGLAWNNALEGCLLGECQRAVASLLNISVWFLLSPVALRQ
jgi:hypothetical protein